MHVPPQRLAVLYHGDMLRDLSLAWFPEYVHVKFRLKNVSVTDQQEAGGYRANRMPMKPYFMVEAGSDQPVYLLMVLRTIDLVGVVQW